MGRLFHRHPPAGGTAPAAGEDAEGVAQAKDGAIKARTIAKTLVQAHGARLSESELCFLSCMFCKASHEQFLFCTERAPTLSDADLAQKRPGSGDGLAFSQLSMPMADSCICSPPSTY